MVTIFDSWSFCLRIAIPDLPQKNLKIKISTEESGEQRHNIVDRTHLLLVQQLQKCYITSITNEKQIQKVWFYLLIFQCKQASNKMTAAFAFWQHLRSFALQVKGCSLVLHFHLSRIFFCSTSIFGFHEKCFSSFFYASDPFTT